MVEGSTGYLISPFQLIKHRQHQRPLSVSRRPLAANHDLIPVDVGLLLNTVLFVVLTLFPLFTKNTQTRQMTNYFKSLFYSV